MIYLGPTWIGIPSVVSDNGPAFIYKEFKTFIGANVVLHKLMAPYHPASNDHAAINIFILLRINVMLWLRNLVILAEQKGYKCYNWQKFCWNDIIKKHSVNNRYIKRYRFPRCIETFELEIGFKSETMSIKHEKWRFRLSFQDWELFITLLMWMVSIPITSNVMWTN